MPCYHPISAWHSAKGVFFHDTLDSVQIKLPCGRCIGCKLERSRQWAVRLIHENSYHDQSAFVTLTYSDGHLPRDGSLNVKHFQDFMKRFRKEVYPLKIRFFHAGEYGDKRGRPHYHAIIFGFDFLTDRYDEEVSDRGDKTWSSRVLDRLWPFGLNRVGSVTFESCAYVARYITKKITGRNANSHYQRICEATGEVFDLKPEYCTMSRRPGIGAVHFKHYASEIYPNDEVISRGRLSKPPKFYDKLLEKSDPSLYAIVKDNRECALAMSSKLDKTERRLTEREAVKIAQIGHLSRRYEIG